MEIPCQMTIHALKTHGHYFAAGALAYALGIGRHYGAHIGMRSTYDYARNSFDAGYDAAESAK